MSHRDRHAALAISREACLPLLGAAPSVAMIQRVKSSVEQRFDSTRAEESELVPLTLADDSDSPRSMGSSSLDTPPASATGGGGARGLGFMSAPRGGGSGGGLQGKKLAYAGSVSDTVMAWPAAADAKVAGRRTASPDDAVRESSTVHSRHSQPTRWLLLLPLPLLQYCVSKRAFLCGWSSRCWTG